MKIVVRDFLTNGLQGQYCLEIVQSHGYDNFNERHGRGCERLLYDAVTGLNFFCLRGTFFVRVL